jgi:hypothetical protein
MNFENVLKKKQVTDYYLRYLRNHLRLLNILVNISIDIDDNNVLIQANDRIGLNECLKRCLAS